MLEHRRLLWKEKKDGKQRIGKFSTNGEEGREKQGFVIIFLGFVIFYPVDKKAPIPTVGNITCLPAGEHLAGR